MQSGCKMPQFLLSACGPLGFWELMGTEALMRGLQSAYLGVRLSTLTFTEMRIMDSGTRLPKTSHYQIRDLDL